jgi:outer membrane protein insertion porin family
VKGAFTGAVTRGRGAGRPLGAGLAVLVVLLGLVAGPARAQTAPAGPIPTVRDILVEGNQRVQAAAILNRVRTRVGDPFSPSNLREDQRAIFALGFFDDVEARVEEFEGGVRVIFVVAERAILREVSFEGLQALSKEDAEAAAAIRIGGLYNPADARRAEESLRQKYEDEGYFGVDIQTRTERTPEGDLRLVFRVLEGRKLYIDRIVIEGNQNLPAGKIKDAMQTKERYFWILPFSTVQRRVFDEDVDRVLNLYSDNGYVQARVDSHEIVPDVARGKVTLRLQITEGPQFRVGSVTFRGQEAIPGDEIGRLIQVKEGDVYNRSLVRSSQRAILDRYSETGRARAEVTPETEVDPGGRRVNVAFAITEGVPVYVERINITGNVKSSEKVLRRELRIAEGELFTYQKLVRSRERLFNLGYFEEVNALVDPGSGPDQVVVRIEVKERATGLFSIGAGYSSLDGIFGTLDITQRNLFGRGQEAFLRLRVGSEARLGLLGFTEPYLFDIPLRAGFDIYNREREYDDFTEDRLGGDIRASYPLAEYLTVSGLYRLETVEVTDVDDDATEDLKKEEGEKLNSVLEGAIAWDTRDNIFEPSRGWRLSLDVAFAGLGGDTQWYRAVGEATYFYPLPIAVPSTNWVVALRALAGVVQGWGGEEVPIFERFFLGGATSLRGQETRSVGPKDANGDTIGGTSEVLFSAELLIPIFPRFRIAFFFDAGNAYGFGTQFDPTDLRLGIGAGLRFFSPLGPLRLDYGYNLDRENGESAGQVHFTVGAPF